MTMKQNVALSLCVVAFFWPETSALLRRPTETKQLGLTQDSSQPYDQTVRHWKEPGGGYKEGSPLWDEQQKVLAANGGAAPPAEAANKGKGKKTEAQSAGDPNKPMFTEKTMPKVSPTLQCVMSLSIQYFCVYTALAILRTMNEFSSGGFRGPQAICEVACTTVTYAPMLCVLFLGCRMRAIQLTQGETEKYQLPQPWAQNAMYWATYAVLTQVLLVLAIPIVSGSANVQADEEGNVNLGAVKTHWMIAAILSGIRYLAMLALYAGIIVVCFAVYNMEAPVEIWGDNAPPVSPAVACTINLTIQFFVVYLVVAIARTMIDLSGGGHSRTLLKLEAVFTMAKLTVNFAPMLCILFIGARMRALQIDPKNGNPQKWAQNCFYLCTYSVLIQCILVIALPYATGCEAKRGASEGDVTFVGLSPTIGSVVTALRYICMLALYGGFTAVMVSVFIIEHPTDPALTPAISPAMSCVMTLTVQYFTVYPALFIAITYKQFAGQGAGTFAIAILEGAQKTVMFAPMLSMLFIGCRMRALQLTKSQAGSIPPTAGPQHYAQEGMFLSTWSVFVQLIMVMIVPIALGGGKAPEVDEEGNVRPPAGTGKIIGIILSVLRYLCLLSMYGGVVAVMVAVYTMTPEELPPYAPYSGLIPGVEVPKPPTPSTPGTTPKPAAMPSVPSISF